MTPLVWQMDQRDADDLALRLDAAKQHLAREWDLHRAIERELADFDDEHGGRVIPRNEQDRLATMRMELRQLRHGLAPGEGTTSRVSDIFGAHFRGPSDARISHVMRGGIEETEALITRLESQLAAWREWRAFDPNARGLYRLRADATGKTYLDGGTRRVQPGEVVELTAHQYASWADRFEPVEGEKSHA
jgi:hypothetical protein